MKKILIVDDDLFFRNTITEELTNYKYEVVAESSGRRALILLQTNDFDLAILDIYMPELSGFDILERLNKESYLTGKKRIPVIIITGDLSITTEIKARSLKVSNYLVKPFEMKELLEAVKNLTGVDNTKKYIIK